jgi:SAM-dependent methyltransferase
MRKTYRNHNVKDYWRNRWESIEVDAAMTNKDKYPLNCSLDTLEIQNLDMNDYTILEAGCGNGRLLRYFHQLGYKITGIDFIEAAIRKIKDLDGGLDVEVGDITNLRYEDQAFTTVLAFGLYHNFEEELMLKALKETNRVLNPQGLLCASFRADNLQNLINDTFLYKGLNAKKETPESSKKEFHKINLKKREIAQFMQKSGFKVNRIVEMENMPLLYKLRFFRANSHKEFNENKARSEGYLLSPLGKFLHKTLIKLFRSQFCNLYVVIASKTQTCK